VTNRRLLRGLALLLPPAASVGCGDVTPDRLVGEWAYSCPAVSGRLVLNGDGTYSQEVSVRGRAETIKNLGAWTLSPQRGPDMGRVQLKNCLSVCDGFGKLRKEWDKAFAACSLPVGHEHYLFGRLALGDQDGYPYVKQR
jgi:hypothetical protein